MSVSEALLSVTIISEDQFTLAGRMLTMPPYQQRSELAHAWASRNVEANQAWRPCSEMYEYVGGTRKERLRHQVDFILIFVSASVIRLSLSAKIRVIE